MTPLLDIGIVEELSRVEVAPGDSFLPHFLHTFSGDASGTLERLRIAVGKGETSELAGEAHRLKGASASIGALRLAEALAEIEAGATTTPGPILEARLQMALGLLYRSTDAMLRYCHVARLRAQRPSSARRCNGAP
jgi:HPt (histidine-containing phosphotransfer) domain-containing protein